jgi:hypothetical protein
VAVMLCRVTGVERRQLRQIFYILTLPEPASAGHKLRSAIISAI